MIYSPSLDGFDGHFRELRPAVGDGAVDMVGLVALLGGAVTVAVGLQGVSSVIVLAPDPPRMCESFITNLAE